MGVKDISQIIKRYAPSSVTSHRSLAPFSGKRFALDANLLLTKFHFMGGVSEPDDGHGPVRALHRFLKALERENISPVIVFDGDTRLPAKADEVKRRADARQLQQDRGAVESVRTARLSELRSMWELEGMSQSPEVLQGYRECIAGTARVAITDERDEAQVERLVQLYDSFQTDETNPLYSLNQRKIAAEERNFFDSILAELPVPPILPLPLDLPEFLIDPSLPLEDLTEAILTDVPISSEELDRTVDIAKIWSQSSILEASHVRRSIPVSRTALAEAKQLVHALGLSWIKPKIGSPAEAEGLCATLYNRGMVDYVVSEDTDVAVYGAPCLRRITTRSEELLAREEQRRADFGEDHFKVVMNVLDPIVLKAELGLNQAEFVDFALLCGTDFTTRIPKLGPVSALKHIREHRNIEAILARQKKFQPLDPVSYMESIEVARKIFLNPPEVPDDITLQRRAEDPYLDDLLKQWGIGSRDGYGGAY